MDNKLKPCPFCGSVHLSVLDYESRYRVECNFCKARSGIWDSEADAVDAWNRRVRPTFTFREFYAIYEVFTAPNPSRFLTDGYHSIVEKCELALKGDNVE